ncbi:hypothetical protein ONZ45_g5213 [Pleurotus djamor]|nr:hypothetical protein ONZ45_g5213 [Pleurotus djamor]
MPKKPRTPPPGDDEPKYLAIYKSYPLNTHWELPSDCRTFARWFACCVGKDDLLKFLAFFHKPRARGIVIVEMDRSYQHFDRLLGEHAWGKFLKNPSHEEKDGVSQVFYSTYSSGREAQKDGWKRVNVEDEWFRNWAPNNALIHFPYPATTWCPTPHEDKTNKPMCRPLPQAVLPAPPKLVPPVVGSANWVATQGKPTASALRGAWGAGRPRGAARGNGPSVSIPRSEQPIITSKAKSPTNAWSKPAASIPWGSPPSSNTSNTPPGLSPLTPSSAGASPRLLPQSGIGPNQVQQTQQGLEKLSLAHPDDICDIARDEGVDPAHVYMASWERSTNSARDGSSTYETAPLAADSYAPTSSNVTDSLWDDDEPSKSTSSATAPALICKTHGVICKKGICLDYSKQLKEAERAKKLNEKGNVHGGSNGNRKNGWRGGRRGGGNGGGGRNPRDNAGDDGFSVVSRKQNDRRAVAPLASRSSSSKSSTSNEDNNNSNLWGDGPVKAQVVTVGTEAVDVDDSDDDDGW